MKDLHRGEKGLTLIELLIIIAILGVLAAIIVPNLVGFIGTGKVAAANTEVANAESAALAYFADQSIFNTGCQLLNQMLSQQKQPIRLICIGVSNLVSGKQLDMLDASSRRLEQLDRAIDRIRRKYGFTAIQTGRTLPLKDIFPPGEDGYTLHTPSLSR